MPFSVSKKALGLLLVATISLGVVFTFQKHKKNNLAAVWQSAIAPSPLPDGTLIRSSQDERVYYMEGGRRRWITSGEVFQAQGFRTDAIRTLTDQEVERYQEGDPITLHSLVTLPSERGLLPDIAPLAPYELRLATVNGRRVIRFTGSFWNQGQQPFHLMPGQSSNPAGDGQAPVYQQIKGIDGVVRQKLIDNFIFHPAHNHLHLMNFGYYVFLPLRSASGEVVAGNPFIQQKTTFCMRDDELMTANLPYVPARPLFQRCGVSGQGVSVGWIDVYRYTLPDQYVDVHDMPPGVYSLSFLLDPEQHYLEDRKDNNIGTTLIELDGARGVLRVLASLAPFPTTRNQYPDGLLLRGGDDRTYAIQGGKKRWIRSAEVFQANGYNWNQVYVVPQSLIDVIPSQILVRAHGKSEVYALNDQGYRRHILTPEAFSSYGFTPTDILDVSEQELLSMPETNLIMHIGDETVYQINGGTRRALGARNTLGASGYELQAIHLTNETDFSGYVPVP
jgi:hypothetical protein